MLALWKLEFVVAGPQTFVPMGAITVTKQPAPPSLITFMFPPTTPATPCTVFLERCSVM